MSFQKSPFVFDLCLGSGHLLDQMDIREACHQTHLTLKSQVFAFLRDPPPTSAPCKSSAQKFPSEEPINAYGESWLLSSSNSKTAHSHEALL